MTTTLPAFSVGNEGLLPDDLSRYIGKKTLVKLILEAMEEPGARSAECAGRGIDDAVFRPAMMLTLLTYCYASGIYGSVDIQLGTQHDQMIRYLCAGSYPDICMLRSFRRYHRETLEGCLTATLRQVWELRFCGEDAEPILGVSCIESSLRRWTDVKPTPDFKREAGKRITQAVRADSMAADL